MVSTLWVNVLSNFLFCIVDLEQWSTITKAVNCIRKKVIRYILDVNLLDYGNESVERRASSVQLCSDVMYYLDNPSLFY